MNIIATLLALSLIVGVVLYEDKVNKLEQALSSIPEQPVEQQVDKPQNVEPRDTSAPTPTIASNELDSLNTQLIEAQNKIRSLERKVSLNSVGQAALKNEINKTEQIRRANKALEISLKASKNSLLSTRNKLNEAHETVATVRQVLENERVQAKTDAQQLQQLKTISAAFKQQHKTTVENNIGRIQKLKEASGGTLIAGAIVPIIGAASLVTYTVNEIKHYCQEIKNNIALEKQLFGQVVLLNDKTIQKYTQQCLDNPIVN